MPEIGRPIHILAIKLADIGDLLTITPALQALRAAHPSSAIDLLAPPSSAGLLEGSTLVDRVITFDKFPFDSLRGLLDVRRLAATAQFLAGLRSSRYDALAIFHHFTTRWGTAKFALVSRLSGAKVRAGIDNGRGRFLTLRAPDRGFGAMHEAGYWLSVAALLGADLSTGWQPVMPVTGEDRTAALALLGEWQPSRNGGEPLVVLHPGAGAYSLARMWPVERFAEVARALVDTAGARIVLVGGPGEQTLTRRLAELVARPGRVLDLAGQSDVHQTAAIIEQCDLFLGNDSGPMHIAAAVRTPVVAVFGPSNQAAWGPYTPPGQQSQHTIVARELPCMPCFYRVHSLGLREGCGTRPCLTGLGSEQVLRACLQKLEGSRVT